MYQVDSNCHQEMELALSERKVVAFPLRQENPDCVSTDETLEVNFEKHTTQLATEQRFAQVISHLLHYGVLLSSAIVLLGGILYLIHNGAEVADYRFFLGEPAEFCSPKGVLTAVLAGYYRGIIQLGILFLIATPIIRVAFSLITFLWRRDFTYAILTFLVMVALVYSFIGAYT